MDAKQQSQTEYATQFFDFVPQSLVDELSENSNQLIQEALTSIKQKITSKYSGKVDPDAIAASIQKIEDKYLLETDKVFEKVVSFLCARVLRVAGHVLLPEDQVWDTDPPPTTSRLTNLNVELDTLRQKIKTAKYKNVLLKQSLDEVKEVSVKQQSKLETFDKIFKEFNVQDWRAIADLTAQDSEIMNKKIALLENLNDQSDVATDDNFNLSDKRCLQLMNSQFDEYENMIQSSD